ncbi:MAG: lytic transglycosylase domain-containing protein, partial [Gammaproteobacteria bacterium]|nr:lytic transglycosylase domain-containing protein [Gammaproteobacteria bacterium]
EVSNSNLYKKDRRPGLQTTIWKWVREYAHPRMKRVRIDLKPALYELRSLIPGFLPAHSGEDIQSIVDSVRLSSVANSENGISATLAFEVHPGDSDMTPAPELPLTEQELLALRIAWRRWDAFITFVIKHTALATQDIGHRDELFDILLDARYTMLDALTNTEVQGKDPVRELFLTAWPRLAPIMRTVSGQLIDERGLQFLSFIAAADALNALDQIGPTAGWDVSTDALRRMARIMLPTLSEDPLDYGERVDPELRDAFDFKSEPLPPAPPSPGESRAWPFISRAFAAGKTNLAAQSWHAANWVPKRGELPVYLSRVRTLLHDTVNRTLREKPLDPKYHKIFRPLVLATAWQETCWRQFVLHKGKIRPMRSGAGAVGIMQVVPAVWRGFYEPKTLETDIRYNATAGSEILQHYLERYAIRKGEHKKTGNMQNLARATYAAYNGGPRQLSRYRTKNTPKSLKKIDSAFWDKYKKVRDGDELAVINCYDT